MFLKDRNFLSWAMWLEQLHYPAPIRLLKIGNFQSGFLIAKISSWHWTPFSFPSWFGLFSYSKKPKASQPARQPTSKSVHSITSRGYIGISHQDEKFPPLWASSNGIRGFIQLQNWMRQRGFSAWGIQTGPFAACWAPFVLKIVQLFHFHTGESNLIAPESQ